VTEIFILSIIQGITEFLPVSSSSHLILVSEYLNFDNQSLSVDVSLHIGSFLAVVSFFHKEILNFYKNRVLFIKILISSVPVMVIGFFLIKTNLIEVIRNIKIISWTTIVFGILLYISDKCKLTNNLKNDFKFKSAITIGIFQIFSLIPGVSRSGIGITAARFLGFNREDATKISFLLSIPILGAVSIHGIGNIFFSQSVDVASINIFAILISFLFSLITIKFFLEYIKKFNLKIFVYYRILLGLILMYFAYL
tara:strand:+ start:699 stop:1457 length:759 start_codon:yes stop_codon:yes gene_type:complete